MICLFYSVVAPLPNRTAAMSDASQLESELKGWADSKVREGKLKTEDVLEIFPESYSLSLGGENPNQNFLEMVADIATRNRIPTWTGLLSFILGFLGLISYFRAKGADQDDADNPCNPPRNSKNQLDD